MKRQITVFYDDGGFRNAYSGVARYFTEMIRRFPLDIKYKFGMVSTTNMYLQKPPFRLPRHKQDLYDFIRDVLNGRSFPGVSHVYRILARMMPSKFPSGELANDKVRAKAF